MSIHSCGLGESGKTLALGDPDDPDQPFPLGESFPLGEPHTGPLGVSPKSAGVMLSIGQTRVYQLIDAGELEIYKEGAATRITVRSIHARVKRLIAQARAKRTLKQGEAV